MSDLSQYSWLRQGTNQKLLLNLTPGNVWAKVRSPDLWIGTTLADFQTLGNLPWTKEKLNSCVIDGASSAAHSFSILGEIVSGPFALFTSRVLRTLKTSATEQVKSSTVLSVKGVTTSKSKSPDLWLKTLWKNLSNISAFAFGVKADWPPYSTQLGILKLPVRDLTKDQNFLLLLL